MDYAPIDPETLERIRRQEDRQKVLSSLPPIDWQSINGGGWRVIAKAPESAPYEDRMREFYRLRKQAKSWSAKTGIPVAVRRANQAREIMAKVG